MDTTTRRGRGRPRLPDDNRLTIVSCRVTPAVRDRLQALAHNTKTTIGEALREVIDRFFDYVEKELHKTRQAS